MAFKTKSTAERLPHTYKGATIFFHRLAYARQGAILHLCTERGEIQWRQVNLMAAQEAVDGWDDQVLDADEHAIPVPSGPEQERRARIAEIVAAFPTDLIVELFLLSFADDPDQVKKNWNDLLAANSPSPTAAPGSSSPAPTADGAMPRTATVPPVTDATA